VLCPGGHALIITECLTHRHPLDRVAGLLARVRTRIRTGHDPGRSRRNALAEVFAPHELKSLLVEPSGLAEMQRLQKASVRRRGPQNCPARRPLDLHLGLSATDEARVR
jgi:hypothetical protein